MDLLQLVLAARLLRDRKRSQYDTHRVGAAEKQRQKSLLGRDIGELPEVAEPDRKAAGLACFKTFCETYGKGTFTMGWSPDHLKVIEKIEKSVVEGELFAMAMPRGSGKTSLCEWGAIWAISQESDGLLYCSEQTRKRLFKCSTRLSPSSR